MRTIVLIDRLVKMLTLFLVIVPKPALCDTNRLDAFDWRNTSLREMSIERDPQDENGCFSMGELDIVFLTDNNGPPNVGVVLTDPRGRRIGFDPLSNRAWQDLPVAQGDVDCDDPNGAGTCRGRIQICGPLTGTYTLELVAQKTTAYSVSISARSKGLIDGNSLQSSRSEADLNNVMIRARSRDVVLLNYSRAPQDKVTAQLQHSPHALRSDTRSHRHPDLEARKK
jgi:hypothetical protein